MKRIFPGTKTNLKKTLLPVDQRSFLAASLIIALVLLLQGIASFRILCPPESIAGLAKLRLLCAPASYPFLDYPMYKDPHYDGERINQIRLVGTLEDGSEIQLAPEDLGLNYWLFEEFLYAIDQDEREIIEEYVRLYQNRYRQRIVNLRIESEPYVLSKTGARPVPLQVLKDVSLDWMQ